MSGLQEQASHRGLQQLTGSCGGSLLSRQAADLQSVVILSDPDDLARAERKASAIPCAARHDSGAG